MTMMARHFRASVAPWVLVMGLALGLSGCQAASHSDHGAQPLKPRLELTLSMHDETADELFEIHRDGTFRFGGGMDARLGHTSWSTRLDDADRQRLADLIDRHGWIAGNLKSTGSPESLRYRISIRTDRGSARHSLKGHHPDVEPIYQELRKISLRRLDADLQRLPEPGPQDP